MDGVESDITDRNENDGQTSNKDKKSPNQRISVLENPQRKHQSQQ
jgi:hypothetical protein